MRIIRTDPFKRDFKKLPENIKRRTEKALKLLVANLRHPSLQIKKTKGEVIKGYSNVFEERITKNYRFLVLIQEDAYILIRCGRHDEFF